jgi:immune inhibitor A
MAHQHCIMPCSVPPHPELLARMKTEVLGAKGETDIKATKKALKILHGEKGVPGMNDGTIFPRSHHAQPISVMAMGNDALERKPLRGNIRLVREVQDRADAKHIPRVIVVLIDFQDLKMTPGTKQRMEDLWFSTDRNYHTGSVNEYYSEVSNGAVSINGEVIGPFTLSEKLSYYSNHRKHSVTTFLTAVILTA